MILAEQFERFYVLRFILCLRQCNVLQCWWCKREDRKFRPECCFLIFLTPHSITATVCGAFPLCGFKISCYRGSLEVSPAHAGSCSCTEQTPARVSALRKVRAPETAGHRALRRLFTCLAGRGHFVQRSAHCGHSRTRRTGHCTHPNPQFITSTSHSELLYMDPAKSSAILSTCGIADAAATGSVHLCRHHAGSGFGKLALRRLLSAPHHASD